MSGIIAFFRASPPKAGAAFDEHRFRRVRWQTFIAMTLAYVTFYVCRLSFTVAKSALVELGITPTELGMIGSTLFFSYAIGKLVNGFIADHANVVRYMSLGLLLSAGMNLMMGMTTNALLLAIFWGINGWAQSMGVGPCAVSLARWYGVKERGTFYGIWSTAHNIGEAVTYMVIAAVIAGFGWQMGYLSTAALGAAGVVLLVLFMHDSPQSSGFPSINVIRDEPQEEVEARGSVFKNQLLPLLTENYDLSNDVLYTAQKRGSVLLNAMLDGVKPEADPNVRWLLLVAHDTNIAMVRTLMNFSWQLPGYSRGNIPPGSSLVLERWRNAKSGERYLRVYFQAQGLDDLRRLQTPDAQHPMLRQEWRQPGCRQTDVGTLCPFQAAITALGQRIDRSSAPAVAMVLP